VTQQANTLLRLAREKAVLIATAESCTGGLIAGKITSVAGSSAIFDRGFVTYTNTAKSEMLGVTQDVLDQFGAVSEQVAREMAEGALTKSNAQIAVSVTGIAGPGASDHKPEGRVCFGLALTSGETITETVEFGAVGRKTVRHLTVERALNLLITHLAQHA